MHYYGTDIFIFVRLECSVEKKTLVIHMYMSRTRFLVTREYLSYSYQLFDVPKDKHFVGNFSALLKLVCTIKGFSIKKAWGFSVYFVHKFTRGCDTMEHTVFQIWLQQKNSCGQSDQTWVSPSYLPSTQSCETSLLHCFKPQLHHLISTTFLVPVYMSLVWVLKGI